MQRAILGLCLTASLTTGCASAGNETDPEDLGKEQAAITGGSLVLANVEPYSSSVKLFGTSEGFFCSGVKIGTRRFLTAGHCIIGIDPRAGTGAGLTITNSLAGTGGTNVKVSRFYPHPSFSFPGLSDYTYERLAQVYDIAVLDVDADTPAIPSLGVDSTVFGDNWVGTMVSYGCDGTNTDYKKQVADFTSSSLAQFQSKFVWAGYSHAAGYSRYMVFDGRNYSPGVSFFKQGCPGDSGGPIVRFENGWKVAGINSHIWSAPLIPNTPTPNLTWSTRVAPVTGWLASNNKIKGAPGTLTNAVTGKCLGVNGSAAESAPVVQELCADHAATSNSQFWTKVTTVGVNVRFVNGRSGKCLHSMGTSIVQRSCNANDPQQNWQIVASSPALTTLINVGGGYAGSRNGVRPFGSVNVDVAAGDGTNRQRWIWTP